MKKAMLPLYTILVIGCLACLQTDDNLNLLNLTAYFSGNELSKNEQNSSTIIVVPEVLSGCKTGKSAYSLTKTLQNNCCKLAAGGLP